MSDLRNQLRTMRDEYRGEKYPGDLAAEMLAPAPRRLPVWYLAAAGSALAAIAAAVVLWVSVDPAVTPVGPAPSAAFESVAVVPISELGTMPALPDDLPLVPESQSISELGSMSDIGGMPEMPSMPSMEMNFSYDAEASEESV